MKKKNFKGMRIFGEILVSFFLIGIFAGIWIPTYRWRLISTSIFCFFLVLVVANYIKSKEE